MRILMISAESNPLFKCGGLGDVVYSLSKKMVTYKHRVSIFIPFYKHTNEVIDNNELVLLRNFDIVIDNKKYEAKIYQYDLDGIRFLLLENSFLFSRDKIYGYEDDMMRFSFFTKAARKYIEEINKTYDIIHVHDWHAGLLPYLLRNSKIKSKFVITIHNPIFVGNLNRELASKYFDDSFNQINDMTINEKNEISFLKIGILYSSKITTVSPNHAVELLNDSSFGLSKILKERKSDFLGILNGIDVKEFNPDKDIYIKKQYSKENVLMAKQINKKSLLRSLHLSHPEYPLFGIVSRLTNQKGMDLLSEALPILLEKEMNFIILGLGDSYIEEQLKKIESKHKNRISVILDYSDELAHKIYASSDFFLMPSLYEPCGIGQMIALRYGTIPCVREIGGMKDTIIPFNGYNEKEANGFTFYSYTSHAFISTINFAIELHKKPRKFSRVVHNAMDEDNSWNRSYQKYIDLYKDAIDKE